MSMKNFVIVTFVDEDDAPGIISSNWIIPDENTCYYPNVRTEEMKNKLLKNKADPEDTWPQYEIKILKSYETYGEARLHLKKAEETSNLDSDEEVTKRKRKIKKVYLPEDSNSSDDYTISKVAKSTLAKRQILKYPIPPKPKSVAKENPSPSTTSAVMTFTPVVDKQTALSEETAAVSCPRSPIAVINIPFDSNQEEVEADIIEVSYSDVNSAVSCPPSPSPSSGITIPSGTKQVPKRIQLCSNPTVNSLSGCAISKQFAIQQSHLTQVVTDLTNQVVQLNRKVDLLLVRSGDSLSFNPTEDPYAIPDFLASLPVTDEAKFCHLNDQLKINQNKQAFIKYLAGIGGRNVRGLMTNMLRRVLIDNVAELYSLTGKQMKNSNKKQFLTTEVCKIMFQICKKVYEDTTDDIIKEITSDWLNQAKVRTTRRAERQKKGS